MSGSLLIGGKRVAAKSKRAQDVASYFHVGKSCESPLLNEVSS